MKENLPFVSVITANYNGKHLLLDCFDSLLRLNYPQDILEIIMVDNYSTDGSIDYVAKNYPKIKIIENNINNYCRSNNLGINKAKGQYVAILNNDTKVEKDWLIELVKAIDQGKNIGAAGSKVLFMDGRIQSAGHLESPNYYWGDRGLLEEDRQQYDKQEQVQSISNCSALYLKKALLEAEMFDEDFGMYMEDVDMGHRLKKNGWGILYVPTSVVYHKLHGSQQSEEERQFLVEKNRLLFIAKYFPEKLPEGLCGFGDITRLKYSDLDKILIAVFNKLIKHHEIEKVKDVLLKLQKGIGILSDYRQLCFRKELENRTLDINQKLLALEQQNESGQKLIKAKDDQINAQQAELRIKEEQLKAKLELIQAREEQNNAQNEQVRVLSEESKTQSINIQNQQDIIKAKDDQINAQQAELRIKEEQLKAKLELIQAREEQNNAQNEQVRVLSEESKTQSINIQNQQDIIKAKDDQINAQQAELRIKEEQLKAKLELIQAREEQNNAQNEQVRVLSEESKTQSINIQNQQDIIKAKDDQIYTKDKIISQKSNELLSIYNSETYRFIVKPFVWPVFSCVKILAGLPKTLLHKNINSGTPKKKSKYVCISQFYSKNAEAKAQNKNEYFIKLVNNEFKDRSIKLVIDIWPHENRSHPDRHYAYFAIDATIKPKDADLIKIVYDWDKHAETYLNDKKIEMSDFWRGTMSGSGLYIVVATAYDLKSNFLDDLTIMQKRL